MSTQGPAEAETPLQIEVAAAAEPNQPTEPTLSSPAGQNVNIKVKNTVKASKARSPPLFLSNLPTNILPQILWTRLEIFGSIERLWIERTATGEPTGEATVIYSDDELPDRIVRLQQSIPIFLEGHAISASFRNGLIKPFGDNWVLVYNLPEHITEEDVQRAFARFSPLRIRFKRSPERRAVLRTAVRFESKQQANKVVEECARNPLTISDRQLCVLHNGVFVTNSAAGHWLLVRDLPDSANSEDLDGLFPEASQVVIREPSEVHPRRSAFIRINKMSVVLQIVEKANSESIMFNGAPLRVQPLISGFNDRVSSRLSVTIPPAGSGEGIGVRL